MNVSDLLEQSRVQANVSVVSKKRALEEVSALLSGNQAAVSQTDAFSSLINRERLGTTALGRGLAIPHGRVAGLTQAIGACIKLAEPVDYDANDGTPVSVVFGLLVPEDANEEHLQTLRNLAAMFSDEQFCQQLQTVNSDQALFELLIQHQPS